MGKTTFTIEFENGIKKSITANYINPDIVIGWWSYDKEGNEVYTFQSKDDEGKEKRNEIPLGETMYFHVEVKGIRPDNELEFQLYDHDELFPSNKYFPQGDFYDPDDSKFPNDPVIKKASVRQVGDRRIATVELKLEEDWESVIYDDHDGYMASRDHTIELYWKISYKHIVSTTFPNDEDHDRLRVGYNERDLFIKPIVEGSGLPEFYDKKGKLLIFAFKMLAKVSKELNPNPYISSVFVSSVRITEIQTLSAINKVKKTLLYERVSWDTNESVRYGYKSVQTSNYVIKGTTTFEEVTEFTTEKTKKFSDFFNRRDIKNGTAIAIQGAREALRILDFINATKTVHSIFKEPEKGLQIPKPSSVVSAMGLLKVIRAVPGFGALSPLFMVADVIATKVVNEIINEFTEDSRLAWEHQKMKGLNAAYTWVKTGNDGAKMLGLDVIEYLSQSAYEKLLCSEFKNFKEFYDYQPKTSDNDKPTYTCFYYVKEENGRKKYLIDSIFLR